MRPSISPSRCMVWVLVASFTLATWVASGTSHRDLRTSATDWPSLALHFTLKRDSMQLYGHQKFSVYANPVVSADGLSVLYDGSVSFTQGSTLTSYMLVGGVAYSMISSKADEFQSSSTMSQCLPADLLPPFNELLPALNNATRISSATLGGSKIKCSGDLFEVTFRGLFAVVCASGSSGIRFHGSDMDIRIKYLENPVQIAAPELNISPMSECETVMEATAVTATTIALLTGRPIPEDELRVSDSESRVTLASTSCACKSKPRPCLFIHGLGINYAEAELQDSFSAYWGNVSDHAPCCTDFKYMIWNSVETGWNNHTQQQTMCDLAATMTESGSPNEIADTIVITHSMSGLVLASAIANGKCTLAENSTWVALSAPMTGSMGSDYTQKTCAGQHSVTMELVGNVTGQCPVLAGTKSLAYQGESLSTVELNEAYEAAQKVYQARVYAAMCSDSYLGLLSSNQARYWLLGSALPHKSDENDGMVEFQSCAGGLPREQFGDHYKNQFYVTQLNHGDTTFYYGDGLFSSAMKPVKWFECVL